MDAAAWVRVALGLLVAGVIGFLVGYRWGKRAGWDEGYCLCVKDEEDRLNGTDR